MKRIFVALASTVMAIVMCLTCFSGCNLVTVNNERNVNQVVATVKISEDAPSDKIYKKEILMAYLNYGYVYEQNYGYTREKTINTIINRLITTRVYVQQAVIEFNTKDTNSTFYGNVVDSTKGTWDLERYLTEEEIVDVYYSTRKDINDLIDGYVESEESEATDTFIGEQRPVPTGATNEEKELSLEEKKAYKIDTNSTTERRKAYNKVIKLLENNELKGSNYNGDVTSTTYYQQTVKGYQENKILQKYEDCITKSAIKTITFDDLKKVYANNFETQTQMSDAEFAEKLSSATAEEPVLIGKDGSYGYVYNLLLGANKAQTAEIEAIETTDISKREQQRKEILDKTIVKDLRSSWLISGYDFDTETNCFTGDYTFAENKENSLPFQGTVKHLNAQDKDKDDYVAKYAISSLKEFTLNQFVDFMDQYVYGSKQTNVKTSSDSINIFKKVNTSANVSEYDEKINELLFAFSTDSGSLNTYKGYAIEPKPDEGSETYVQEFADAGRELLEMGGRSYIMVATDYGYHVMFYSQAFNGSEGFDTLEKYLNYECSVNEGTEYWNGKMLELVENWTDEDLDTDSFLYSFFNSVSSVRVNKELSKVQNQLMHEHVYGNNGGVTRYPKTYEDLLNA